MANDERQSDLNTAASTNDDVVRGLSAADVAARVARGHVNRPRGSPAAEYGAIVVRNLFTLFNAMVVPAAVALFMLGDYRSAWSVSAIALINAVAGLVQESRAKHHLDQLAILTEPKACVRRDGQERTIDAGDVVLDDVVVVRGGDAVVADGSILESRFLEIDESLLTGESNSIAKRIGDRLLSGSICVAGEAAYRIDGVGDAAYAAQMSAQARRYRYSPSPIQRLLNHLIRILTATAIALCAFEFALWNVRGFPITDLWQMIAATVTSMVPQGLVLTATLMMVVTALRLTVRGAAIQRLAAVEAMASIDVLCLDKTGTLTTGRLSLDRVRTIAGDDADVRSTLRLFAWASIDMSNKTIRALREGLGAPPVDMKWEVVDQIPFKSQNRYSAARIRAGDAEKTVALGAFETLSILLNPDDAKLAELARQELSLMGFRLLVFAEAIRDDNAKSLAGTLDGFTLRPKAIVVLRDEMRPGVTEALRLLADSGIEFKVLSGDSPRTVQATVQGLPLRHETVITGDEFEAAEAPGRIVEEFDVFARVTPQQKLAIVANLQAHRRRVGMIGDGINDIMTIKRSDLGIAMGTGSNAARTVAGLVLENDDFGLLPTVLREGLAIDHNLRRAAKLFLLKNVYSLILIIVGLGLLRLGFPYLPQQVTLLNVLTIGGPALLLMFGRAPVRRTSRIEFLRDVGLFVVAGGLGVAAAALVARIDVELGAGVRVQRTYLLSTLILIGMGNIAIVANGDRRLLAWAAAVLPIYAATMYVPLLADFFVLTPLSTNQWLNIAATALVGLVPCRLAHRISLGRRQA